LNRKEDESETLMTEMVLSVSTRRMFAQRQLRKQSVHIAVKANATVKALFIGCMESD